MSINAENSVMAFNILTKPIADQDIKDNTVPPALIEIR